MRRLQLCNNRNQSWFNESSKMKSVSHPLVCLQASIPVKDAWKGDRGGPLEHNDSVLDFREPQQG